MIPLHMLVTVLALLEPPAAKVEVRLESARESIELYEPLLLKVRASNDGNRALLLSPPLSSISGNLYLECKPPGSDEYRKVRLPSLNRRPIPPSPNWEAGSSHAAYLFLSSESLARLPKRAKADEKAPVKCLAVPGLWTFRASVVLGDGTLVSNTVKVCVRDNKKPEPKESAKDAFRLLLSFPSVRISAEDLQELEKHLKATPKVPLAHQLLLQLGRISNSTNQAARLDATKSFDELTKEAEPLELEYWRLVQGTSYYHCGDYDAAKKSLKSAPDENSQLKSFLEINLRGK